MKFSRISGRGLVMTKEAGVFMSRKGGIFFGGMRLIEQTNGKQTGQALLLR